MPLALLQILKLIASLGGGLAGQKGIQALLSKFGPSITSKVPQSIAQSTIGKGAGAVGKFGAEALGFETGASAVQSLFAQQHREPDVSDVDTAMQTPYPNSAINQAGLDRLRQQAALREALEQMGVSGLV